ncbi:PepSY-associated TM helix domain-containing protein [Neolewinella agarilytica]|uniref:PepSY-associated TM helix domain-containing protein n=1 Tax=Neolewinella agarilytica TaxID=478744 RepID=UPI0023536D7C|nr:PepSY-associated TM helix domain-containing protein [Neolewinella agarilytica]
MPNKRQRQAKFLRKTRKLHRLSGISLFVFFFIMAVTGILLGWKKNSAEIIMPDTYKGESTDQADWLPMDSLSFLATQALFEAEGQLSEIDRIDVRPSKGSMKFLFQDRQLEVQLDATTGEPLSVGRRHNDWIEAVHDGSIVDDTLGVPHGIFKVFYNSVMGIALIIFTVTGFWLWYGPRRMRR